jgi:hypothetical protein
MTRFAPTLLVGLGGSGVKVLRWIRHRQLRRGGVPREDLLVYRGIDFDLDANSGSRADALEDGEFFYFDASAIADCVGNLRAELRVAPGETPRRPFREIAEWYPDVDGKFIRYAQAEAVGARQWRPLGRIGFFLHDMEIMQPLREGLVQLESRCRNAGELRPSSICIITSSAGGTGSGILFDVAACLRKYRTEVPIRLILLLPEFFEHVDFTSKVMANAYATLTEVVHFKNQDQRFIARYPRLPEIGERMQNALFQRVYLVGPYIGNRRPFIEPDHAFAHVAELLHVFLTKELRSNAGSYQINDDADQNADAAAQIGGAASRQVFCGVSAASIKLLTYDDLATRWAASFVEHWHASGGRRDMFAAVQAPPTPEELRRLEDYIDASAATSEAEKYLTTEIFAKILGEFISTHASDDTMWNQETLRAFTRSLAEFTGAGATDTPKFLAEPVERFSIAFRIKIAELEQAHELTPFAVRAELRGLAERLRKQCQRAESIGYEELDKFHLWLGGRLDSFLSQPLLRLRIQRLQEWLEKWQAEGGRRLGVSWFAYGIRRAAIDELNAAVARLESMWGDDRKFGAALASATADALPEDRRMARVDLDERRALPAAEILRREMQRADRQPERMQTLSLSMLSSIRQRLAEGNRSRDYHTAARHVLGDLKEHFLFELQPGGRSAGGTQGRFRYLSPYSTYDDDAIRRTILSAATRLFHPGRTDNELRKRTARLVVPQSFAGRDGAADRLKDLCSGLVGASVREVSADGVDENRILILVEDLFHSAEELTAIYDYHSDYSRQRRELFHIRADIPAIFGELITTLDTAGPSLCGNPGCTENLKGTPRTEIFCPGCGNPIRNRCGNSCRVDDLTERPDRESAIARGRCPVCEHPLRTYWWTCTRHGRMPTEVPQCTVCTAEKRCAPEVRPYDADVFVCPACPRRGVSVPFRAPGTLARALAGRAAGDTASMERLLARTLVQGKGCPKCGVDLAPLCRAGGPPHLLSRNSIGWRCPTHSMVMLACGSCDFPLGSRDYFCPRCETQLVDCRFCTPTRAIRPPVTAGVLCTRCKLPQMVPFGGLMPPDEDPSNVFCSNIYGCPAGADLYRTTYPPGAHKRCAVCEDPELMLLDVRTRNMHVDACPFCRVLFDRRVDRGDRAARTLPSGACCLCGQQFATSKALADAPQSFDVALRIASALLDSRDDAVAFGLLFDNLPAAEQHRIPSHIADYARRLHRPAVRRILHPRLTGLLEHYQRQFGCQRTAALNATASEAGRDEKPSETPVRDETETVASVLSSERVSRLRTNDDLERWVAMVVSLGIDYDSFDAALGGSSGDARSADSDEHLQELRDHARALYRNLTQTS